MTTLEVVRVRLLGAADCAGQMLCATDALEQYDRARGELFLECNRMGTTDELRDQLAMELRQRFALKSGMIATFAMRAGKRGP